jgi:hypothetical protein
MIQRSSPASQEPRTEPEIIPLGHADRRSAPGAHAYVDVRGAHRIYVARLGPFGIILLALMIALLTAVMLIVLLGAVLVCIPFVALLSRPESFRVSGADSFVRRVRQEGAVPLRRLTPPDE